MYGRVRLAACMVLPALATFGQDSLPAAARLGPPAGLLRPALSAAPVTGAPYSAQQTGELFRTLADGTHISQPSPASRVYRDSAGRTRIERSLSVPPGRVQPDAAAPPVAITILDPVAHVMYTFGAADKVARRRSYAAPAIRPAATAHTTLAPAAGPRTSTVRSDPDAPGPQITVENLGSRTLEGLLVDGMRRTTVWPAGSRHNDQPITVVTENWIARDLGLPLLSKVWDPVNGNYTRQFTNISRAEPDPSLFRPPAGYTVVDYAVAGMRSASAVVAPGAYAAASPQPAPQAAVVAPSEPAPADASAVDAPSVESSFDDAPPAGAPPDYVGVNAVFIGVAVVNPAASKAPAAASASRTVATPSSGATVPALPKPSKPKLPPPEQPVKQ